MARILKRRETDASGRAVYQDSIARAQLAQVVQCVVGRQERDRYARRRLVAPLDRHARRRRRLGDHMGCEARGRKTHDRIARLEIVHIAPHRDHVAGALHPEVRSGETVFHRLVGQHAHRQHHIAEIESRGTSSNRDLVRGERRPRTLLPLEMVESRRWILQAYKIRIRTRSSPEGLLAKQVQGGRRCAHDIASIRGQDDLVLIVRRLQLTHDQTRRDNGILGDVQIHQPAAKLRMLVHEHSAKSPKRRLRRNRTQAVITLTGGGHGAGSDEPESRRRRPASRE